MDNISKLEQLEQFLLFINNQNPNYVFQTFSDNSQTKEAHKKEYKKRYVDGLAKKLVGKLRNKLSNLSDLNAKGAGIFWQVNGGKARGIDAVRSINACFVDIDNPTYSYEILEKIGLYMPPPTAIIQSSPQKFHVYWAIKKCSFESYAEIQALLAEKFGTDPSMVNIDRVMRLPTFNHMKREPFETQILHFDPVKYTPKNLVEKVQTVPLHKTKAAPDLPPPPVPMMIDPFGLNAYVSSYEEKSELSVGERVTAMVSRVGMLIRTRKYQKEVDEELAIQLDIREYNKKVCKSPLNELELSSEVFGSIPKYINLRNKEDNVVEAPPPPQKETDLFNVDPPPITPKTPVDLQNWLGRYVLVADGKRVADMQSHGEHQFYMLDEFKTMTNNIRFDGNALMFNKWLTNPGRKTARGSDYVPNKGRLFQSPTGLIVNRYLPPNHEYVEEVNETTIEPFHRHMEYLFPNPKHRKVFVEWLVCTVQKPEINIQWAPILYSRHHGVGKSLIYYLMQKLLGFKNTKVIEAEKLVNVQYDDYKIDSVLNWVHELHNDRKINVVDKLKSCITESQGDVNVKYGGKGQGTFYANYCFCTNHVDAIKIDERDRRFWVCEIEALPAPRAHYVGDFSMVGILQLKDDPVALAMLHKWMMDYDLSEFDAGEAPEKTDAKLDMIESSRSIFEDIILSAIQNKKSLFAADIVSFKDVLNYVEVESEMELNEVHRQKVKTIFCNNTQALPVKRQSQWRDDQTAKDKVKVRCVRELGYWRKAVPSKLRREFTRSHQFLLNSKDVSPPILEDVSGGKD